MISVDIHLNADMVIRRRHDGDDIVEIATPTASVRLHVDSKSAPIAAGVGAGLMDAARRQDRAGSS